MTKNIRNAILEEIAHLISIKAIEPIKVNAEQITNRIMCHVSPETTDQRSTDRVVDIEAGARACARWRNGKELSESAFNEMREGEKNAYRQQAKDCAEAWGLKWE